MNNTRKPIPITLLTGYLGAGKTTLINHVLNNQEGYKCAVIVNDIGEVNIDAELIQKTGVVTQEDQNLGELINYIPRKIKTIKALLHVAAIRIILRKPPLYFRSTSSLPKISAFSARSFFLLRKRL